MLVMPLFLLLPRWLVLVLGLAVIVGHNLLDTLTIFEHPEADRLFKLLMSTPRSPCPGISPCGSPILFCPGWGFFWPVMVWADSFCCPALGRHACSLLRAGSCLPDLWRCGF
jgi:uncharacterized membrane protein